MAVLAGLFEKAQPVRTSSLHVSSNAARSSWRSQFHDVPQLVQVYKSKVLSFVEFSAAAMQHELQMLLKCRAVASRLSPRALLSEHPLHLFFLRLRHASFLAVALQSPLVACD